MSHGKKMARLLGVVLLGLILTVLIGSVANASSWDFEKPSNTWNAQLGKEGDNNYIGTVWIQSTTMPGPEMPIWSLRHVSGNACELGGYSYGDRYYDGFELFAVNMRQVGTVVYRLTCQYQGITKSVLITVNVVSSHMAPTIKLDTSSYTVKVGEPLVIKPSLLPTGTQYTDDLSLLYYASQETRDQLQSINWVGNDSLEFLFDKPGYCSIELGLLREGHEFLSRITVYFKVTDANGNIPAYQPSLYAYTESQQTIYPEGYLESFVADVLLENYTPMLGKPMWSLQRIEGNSVTLALEEWSDKNVGAYVTDVHAYGTSTYDLKCTVAGATATYRFKVTVSGTGVVPSDLTINPNFYAAKVGQPIDIKLVSTPSGTKLPKGAEVYLVSGDESNDMWQQCSEMYDEDTQTHRTIFHQSGYYTGYLTVSVDNLYYEMPVSFMISKAEEPDNTAITLRRIATGSDPVTVGQTVTYEVDVRGYKGVQQIVFYAYDENGNIVGHQTGVNPVFSFIPTKPGSFVIRALVLGEGTSTYLQIDSAPLTVTGDEQPDNKTKLSSITGPTAGNIGDSLAYHVYITGSLNEIQQMSYVVYDAAGNEVDRKAGISGSYTFQPKAAGTYVVRAFLLAKGDTQYQYADSQPVVIGGPAPAEEAKLQSIAGPRAGAVGDSLTYGVYITGPLNTITQMVYVVYDANGVEVARQAGISGVYTFKPEAAGTYVVRAFMKAKGDTTYQYADSAPVAISGPALEEKTVLQSINGPKAGAVGDSLKYQVHITGSLSAITDMVYVVYDTNGDEVTRKGGISGEYTFKPQTSGEFVVRAFMKAKGDTAYQYVDSTLVSINEPVPVEKAKLQSVSGPTQANIGDKLVYNTYITGELSTITEMAYVVYDSNGTEVARAVGISSDFAFTPNAAGSYTVRAFMKAKGEGEYQYVDSATLIVAESQPEQPAPVEAPVVVEPVVEIPASEPAVEPVAEVVVEPVAQPVVEVVPEV